MRLENLNLSNFKNYKNCTFDFSPGINFIYGGNGNGKTNILEAISFICFTKSFLQNSEHDCVRSGENEFEVTGTFLNLLDSAQKISVRFNSGDNEKNIFLNSSKINKLNEIIGTFPLVTLSPYDIKLTTGAPFERRRTFDLLISQTSRIYLNDLRNLSRILKQKNALLKENLLFRKYSQNELKNMVLTWNEELLNVSIRIFVRRLDFIEVFRTLLSESFKELMDGYYEPNIDFAGDIMPDKFIGPDLDDISGVIENGLMEKLDLEIKRGISLFGPHRDNYTFSMKKGNDLFDVRTFASQGEHKLFLIALKLAEYKYLCLYGEGSFKGEPVLLLDDILSELDAEKIERLCSVLPNYNQMFITTTDFRYRDILFRQFNTDNAKSFEIINGEVIYAS